MSVKLIIADDHPLIREALTDTFSAFPAEYEVRAVADGHGLLCELAEHREAAMVLLDLFMPGPDGFELLATVREEYPGVKVVVLTASEDPADLETAARLGAAGYVLKSEPSHELVTVVQRVLSGETAFPDSGCFHPDVAGPDRAPETDGASDLSLTDRQMEVLKLIADGFSNKEIARKLDLSENTVKIHVSGIFRALGVSNRTQAAVAARQSGVLPQQHPATA